MTSQDSGRPAASNEGTTENDPAKSRGRVENDIRRLLLAVSPDEKARFAALCRQLEDMLPEGVEAANEYRRKAAESEKLKELAFKSGRGFPTAPDLDHLLSSAAALNVPGLDARVKSKHAKGQSAARRREETDSAKKGGRPLSSVNQRGAVVPPTQPPSGKLEMGDLPSPPVGLHPNDIRALPPANDWLVLIDETGDEFSVFEGSKLQGRVVALILPKRSGRLSGIEELPARWHAIYESHAEVDRVVQSILDHEVGVLGITARSMPAAAGERWLDTIVATTDWILRLLALPATGDVRIEIKVENRFEFTAGQDWNVVARQSIARLAKAWPERARRFSIEMGTIFKSGDQLNGYVDAAAFTWGSPVEASQERLRRTGWRGTCLWDFDASGLLYETDRYDRGRNLPGAEWWSLVSLELDPRSFPFAVLAGLGDETKGDPSLWDRFLLEATDRMATGPVNLRILGRAVDWLSRYQPTKKHLPGPLRLVWLTTKLALANHVGQSEIEQQQELRDLAVQLMDECAPLVCQAELNLAVAYTNRFEFDQAAQLLQRWESLPPMVPGLRFWGQLQSSLGQHSAFKGDYVRAIEYFNRALDAFARLSHGRERDLEQTGIYRAITQMDAGMVDAPTELSLEALGHLLGFRPEGNSVVEAVRILATSEAAHHRSRHHTFLRLIALHNDDSRFDELIKPYLKLKEGWASGQDYPWPHIHGYRALLLKSAGNHEAAVDHIQQAAAMTVEHGPVLRLIASVWRAIAAGWKVEWPEKERLLKQINLELPQAAERLDEIRYWPEHAKQDVGYSGVRELLTRTLPFNFH